jgi:hypothetical protein
MMGESETPNTAPAISDATIAYERSLLSDPKWCAAFPAEAAALQASLAEAIAATGWQPITDTRSAAQIAHDERHGVTVDPDGKIPIPDHLRPLLRQDAEPPDADAELVADQLQRAGLDPETTLADAREALVLAGSDAKAETLSAHALAQLAVWTRHLRASSKTRPQ